MTGCPMTGVNFAASQRARMSVTPPVPPGTRMCTGLLGHGASVAATAEERRAQEEAEERSLALHGSWTQCTCAMACREYAGACSGLKQLV
jgi:hypothetical protein